MEGGDPFASATGTFVVHLFDREGGKHGDTMSGGQRRGDSEIRQRWARVETSDGRLFFGPT